MTHMMLNAEIDDGGEDDSQLSNAFSTGGGGPAFENDVQAMFVVLMLTGGVVPCLPVWPIKEIKLQGKYEGFDTDDFVVFVEHRSTGKCAKLLAQIKHSIRITEADTLFGEVMKAAWNDFQGSLFVVGDDAIALITGPLSATEIKDTRTLLDIARHCANAQEFRKKIGLANFVSDSQRRKLSAFEGQLKKANNGNKLTEDQLWKFLKSFHLLGYDLDAKSGITLSLLHSHIAQFSKDNAAGLFAMVAKEVSSFNRRAGTITRETISEEIRNAFAKQVSPEKVSENLPKAEPPQAKSYATSPHANDLVFALLAGSWNDKNEGDMNAIKGLLETDE